MYRADQVRHFDHAAGAAQGAFPRVGNPESHGKQKLVSRESLTGSERQRAGKSRRPGRKRACSGKGNRLRKFSVLHKKTNRDTGDAIPGLRFSARSAGLPSASGTAAGSDLGLPVPSVAIGIGHSQDAYTEGDIRLPPRQGP